MERGIRFNDPNFLTHAYDKWIAYGQSKTANALFAVQLDGNGRPHITCRAFALHPGPDCIYRLSRHMTEELAAVLKEKPCR